MRRILEASLLLSTVLFTAAAVAGQTTTDATAQTQVTPDSTQAAPDTTQPAPQPTAVVPAQVVYSAPVDLTAVRVEGMPNSAELVLDVSVDEYGNARHVSVLDSDDAALDGPVQAAVHKYQFQPATVNNQPVPSELQLVVNVQR
jgi:hypothetical protein